MRLSYQNKPHWQMARQALNNVCASETIEIQAWRTFRAAAARLKAGLWSSKIARWLWL